MAVLRFSRTFVCLALAVAPLVTLAGGCSSVVTPSGECCNDVLCPSTMPSSDSACGGPAAGLSCSYYTDPASCPEVWFCRANGFWAPQPAPSDGDICPVAGVSCGYDDDCSSYTATCESSANGEKRWVGTHVDDPCCYEGCSCTDLECNGSLPGPGGYCDYDYLCPDSPTSCTVVTDTGCGEQQVTAYCEPNGWIIADPCDCYALGELAACEASSLCDWRVPGCGQNPLGFEGCFPAAPCLDSASCPVGWSCGTVSTGCPPGNECDTCDSPIDLCQPPPDP